jgi:hypothetical protein
MKYVSVVALAGIALLLAGCGKSEPDLEDSKVVEKPPDDALRRTRAHCSMSIYTHPFLDAHRFYPDPDPVPVFDRRLQPRNLR